MHDPERAVHIRGHVPRERDLVPLGRPVERAAVGRHRRRQDSLEAGAVHVDDEHALVAVRAEPLEDDPLPARRPATGHVVAAGVRRDLGKSTAIRRADRVDAVLASVVAERLAEKQRSVGRRDPARVEERRVLPVDDAGGSVVGVDDPRAAAGQRTAGGDVGAVREPAWKLAGVRRPLYEPLARAVRVDDVRLGVAERRVEPGEREHAVRTRWFCRRRKCRHSREHDDEECDDPESSTK